MIKNTTHNLNQNVSVLTEFPLVRLSVSEVIMMLVKCFLISNI